MKDKIENWTEGQFMCYFLEWLAYRGYKTNKKMADPFDISDEDLHKLQKQFINDVKEKEN